MTDVSAEVPAQRTEADISEPDRSTEPGQASDTPNATDAPNLTDAPSATDAPNLTNPPSATDAPDPTAADQSTVAAQSTVVAQPGDGGVAERVQDFATGAAERAGDVAERAAHISGRVAAQVVDRLRNNAEVAAERGTTVIANEVVEKIAGIAAREVPGVYDLGGDVSRVFSAIRDRIGLGGPEGENQGVSVRLDGNQAGIKITLVIEYGFVVHSVTEKVRAKVIGAIENLLGLEVTAVDIVVDDVHVSERGSGDDQTQAVGYKA
jgi:uncharacterized alkaline shock family protein YloU